LAMPLLTQGRSTGRSHCRQGCSRADSPRHLAILSDIITQSDRESNAAAGRR